MNRLARSLLRAGATMPYLLRLIYLSSTFLSAVLLLAGCSCTAPCDFPVQCVASCGATPTTVCGTCPSGTMPISRCIDASVVDAASRDVGFPEEPLVDAAVDAGGDAGRDGGSDAGSDAFVADDAACTRPGYPVDSTATRTERGDVDTAALDFTSRTGVTVDLDPTTAAVTGFSGPFPVTLDGTISDPCMRALDAITHFVVAEAAMMRLPGGMIMRACSYDSLTDAEIVRLHGGTYDGRSLLGADNDLVIHVTRSGTIRFWGGNYLPTSTRLFPQACYDQARLEASLVGRSLTYLHFSACVPGTTGSYVIQDGDTRDADVPALYVDDAGLIHVARKVEVLLLASHVTASEEGSDLYCCGTSSLDGCVGAFVVVDEVTGEILAQMPRCITC